MQPDARDVALPDGTALTIRAIRPDDAVREAAFIKALSAQTGYRRAFRSLRYVSAGDIAKLTQVDFERDAAFVAVHAGGHGAEEIVGVSRFIRDADPAGAEFAITVADRWQRRGLGRLLLDTLLETARKHGIHRLHGVILRSNTPMLGFVKRAGFTVQPVGGDATVMSAVKDL